MANIYKGTLGLVGNTPLVEVVNVEKALGLEATVLVKLEYLNPAGSVKDRIAKGMIEDAEKRCPERGFCHHRADFRQYRYRSGVHRSSEGYRIILTMPETMSVERRNIPESVRCRDCPD